MRQSSKINLPTLVFFDFLAAFLAWFLFHHYRKYFIELQPFDASQYYDQNLFLGLLVFPIGWLIFYYFTGTYTDPYRKSRLFELFTTLLQCLIGVLVLFFLIILDDVVNSYRSYYQSTLTLFTLQFGLTFFFRYLILSTAKRQLENGRVAYNTLLIGGNQKALNLYKEVTQKSRIELGYNFVGFINTNGKPQAELTQHLQELGRIENIKEVCSAKAVEEVILAVETSDHHRINEIINLLADRAVVLKIIPDMYDILSGSVKMNNVMDTLLIEIYPDLMPPWQKKLKRLLDILVSTILLILLLPLYTYIAFRVKRSSKGPIIYKQERIGKNGKPFNILKFRSMYVDAEKDGPALSQSDGQDPRITSWGRIMRKWRLDELLQFYNVLTGDMSLVGPRPERQYYIDQLVKIAPEYRHLHKVQPGITSLGMVKFGYASDLEEMVERMKYDLVYIENMSLLMDFKVMIYTVVVLYQGQGK